MTIYFLKLSEKVNGIWHSIKTHTVWLEREVPQLHITIFLHSDGEGRGRGGGGGGEGCEIPEFSVHCQMQNFILNALIQIGFGYFMTE